MSQSKEVGEPILLRMDAVAKLLSVSRSKAYLMASRGLLPTVRLGGSSLRVPRAALVALIEQETMKEKGTN